MKTTVGYDPDSTNQAFASKWAKSLDEETVALVDLFVEHLLETGKSKKAAASYKSLVSRFLVTNQISEGKSGESMKSAVRSFIRFAEAFADEVDLDELEVEDIDEDVEAD